MKLHACCSPWPSPLGPRTGPGGAVFKWANDGDVRAMDPYTLNETVQHSFLANIYEPLVRRDRSSGLEPALATRWEQTSPTVWRFHLRPGVKWQDGTPFTADDVVFSLPADHRQDLAHRLERRRR